jgi:hypothetical protein
MGMHMEMIFKRNKEIQILSLRGDDEEKNQEVLFFAHPS